MEDFAKRLRHLRVDILNITMKKIGDEMKTGQSRFSMYERGSVKPGLTFIQALCEKYEVSANWLILGMTPIMIKDLSTTMVDTTVLMLKKQKSYEVKLANIQQQLNDAIENYKKTI